MKRWTVFLIAGVLLTCFAASGWAQDRSDQTSKIELAKQYLAWMKAQTDQLDQELLQARREQNSKKINCIEDRLAALKEIMGETDAMNQRLRAFSMQQRLTEANKVFTKLANNQRLAEQIINLVKDCFKNINVEGGFVETLEEWLGEPTGEDHPGYDPTESQPRPGEPEPVPNEFTPGPVSEEEE